MKFAIGSDHAGFEMKERVKEILRELGQEVEDVGTHSKESCDYPDFGVRVARMVREHRAERGVLVCWTGNGMTIAANKVPGVRAGLALNADMAYLTRRHNDANVLTLAQKYTPDSELREILRRFIETEFEGGRHERRLNKIRAVEPGNGTPSPPQNA
ncbi:MAG TPA: ribose 5-phosphate isomerase B [candidate division Zixibacteria bacterium]|nr:ribose 5-phosphate isomerase B [candidate division Zixibacteria bacterium]MDD4918509.1 ribose 5-phosphate isomerase B [candidate division Zixibacteria bacterium]MDM7973379.1 ribose 5-phosphate isomerase B [candidate division Zixibacteria bacterium]HOD67599.1 ribose 5-phosphate isomerase B [candidate division Zixibacteria bacterium]HOZ07853.1 ribose 5-phosphate isomerase B [candidate division Zixibacteria bacterium]